MVTSKMRCHAVQSSHAVQRVFGDQMLFFDALNRMETCEPHGSRVEPHGNIGKGPCPAYFSRTLYNFKTVRTFREGMRFMRFCAVQCGSEVTWEVGKCNAGGGL